MLGLSSRITERGVVGVMVVVVHCQPTGVFIDRATRQYLIKSCWQQMPAREHEGCRIVLFSSSFREEGIDGVVESDHV